MIIKRISLKNIKSYKEARIDFTEGIIGISGLNGSGKSTILESIGYVLFDYLPYTQTEFVRKGEKTGEVSVTIAGADGLDYTVTRRCGSSQSYSITGCDGIKIDGKDDVGSKLCDVLGYNVKDIAQLRSLFDNAVGVLQGTFVSEFLENASKRKAIFDPLLRIDEFNAAHKNLLPLKSMVKERIDGMDRDISYLQGRSSQLDTLSKEKASLHEESMKQSTLLESKKVELAAVRANKDRYDRLEKELKEAEGKVNVAASELNGRKRDIDNAKFQLDICETARSKTLKSGQGFNAYKSKSSEKDLLEKKRLERDNLLASQNTLNTKIAGLRASLVENEKILQEIENCEKEIVTIMPKIQEQEKLESEKENVTGRIKAKEIELAGVLERKKSVKNSKGNMCPILFNVECKSVTDFTSYFNEQTKRIEEDISKLTGSALDINERLKELKNPRLELGIRLETLKKKDRILSTLQKIKEDLAKLISEQESVVLSLAGYAGLEQSIKTINQELLALKPAYEEYQQNIRLASSIDDWQKKHAIALDMYEKAGKTLEELNEALVEKKNLYDPATHQTVKASYDSVSGDIASITAKIEGARKRIDAIDDELRKIKECIDRIEEINRLRSTESEYLNFIERVRSIMKDAGPEVIKLYLDIISREATTMYCEIAGDHRVEIIWSQDYDIIMIEDGREKVFRQLSGGEQMSAALAVRLAILKILTSSDIVFLDEPTQNMDENRRQNLALEITKIKDFRQMVVISHDDTFNANLENVIEIEKVDGESTVRKRR